MSKKVLACTMFLGAVCTLPAAANDTIARFKGGIGVIPISNGAGTANPDGTLPSVTRNVVRNVSPAGQIWVIDSLDARVRADGRIRVQGKGLVLGGGNNAGRATGQAVLATLICEAAAPFVERNTSPAGVVLSPNGDFKIDDALSPMPPTNCASPMLLIRNAANLGWFAVGIVRSGDDD